MQLHAQIQLVFHLSNLSWFQFGQDAKRELKFDWSAYFVCTDGATIASELVWSKRRPRLNDDLAKSKKDRPNIFAFEFNGFDKTLNDPEITRTPAPSPRAREHFAA